MIRVKPGVVFILPTQQDLLTGYSGLLVAVIRQALWDAHAGDPEEKRNALDYFDSEWYRRMLEYLDLPSEWLPDTLERVVRR
jgi:hypothetical protein